MIMFTKQANLGRFGKRWGCLATCLINIIENELERRLTPLERKACIGAWHESENVLISNYKHHEILYPEPSKWDSEADPEWHFLVFDRDGNRDAGRLSALRDLMSLLGVKSLTHKYAIIEIATAYGSHYVLSVDNIFEVNPDPSLNGEEIETRPIG